MIGMKTLFVGALGLAAVLSGASASVTPNDFDAENGGAPTLNYYAFADYTVSTGSVDLIGNGYFDNYPGNGLYVDLAGSTGQFGALTTKTTYAAGKYVMTVGLGGPIYSNYNDGVTISWGSGSQNWLLNGLVDETAIITVTLTSPTQITIADDGLSGNPNIGATLFGFSLTPVTSQTGVPEPLSLSLLGAGLLGLAGLRRNGKSKQA